MTAIRRPAVGPPWMWGSLAVLSSLTVPGSEPARAEPEALAVAPEVAESEFLTLTESAGSGWTLAPDRVVARALETAPSLAEARAAEQLARKGAERARLGLFPDLDVSLRYTRLSDVQSASALGEEAPGFSELLADSDPDPSPFDQAVAQALDGFSEVDYGFPVLDVVHLRAELRYRLSDVFLVARPRIEARRAEVEARVLDREAERASVELASREAFYEYARARAALGVAQSSLEDADTQQQDVRGLVELGNLPPVEASRAAAQVAAAQVSVARAVGGVEVAHVALERLMHMELPPDLPVLDVLRAPARSLEVDVDGLVARAIDQRPELAALQSQRSAFVKRARAERGAAWPSLSLAAAADVQSPKPRVVPQESGLGTAWEVGGVLSWSPKATADTLRRAQEQEARAARVGAQGAAMRDTVELDVRRAYAAYRTAQTALEAARTGIGAAEESYRVRREQLMLGEAAPADVIDSIEELRRARLQLLEAALDLRLALARLAWATGDRGARPAALDGP